MSLPDPASAADVAGARRALAALLEKAGKEAPALDARLIVGHALGLDHAGLVAAERRPLSAAEREAIASLAARRLAGEPVARILGEKEFWGLRLSLSAATLVPRPDTETVVEAALEALGARRTAPLRIADLGTGSGALLLALLHECPDAFGVGTDRSAEALVTARANAQALGLSERADFIVSDFGAALASAFDLVVCNPPYIASGYIASLAVEVREHDPRLALDGGGDGLDAYRALAAHAVALLREEGLLVLEIGAGQAAAVAAILRSAGGLMRTAEHCDLAGHPRALTFRRGTAA